MIYLYDHDENPLYNRIASLLSDMINGDDKIEDVTFDALMVVADMVSASGSDLVKQHALNEFKKRLKL